MGVFWCEVPVFGGAQRNTQRDRVGFGVLYFKTPPYAAIAAVPCWNKPSNKYSLARAVSIILAMRV